MVKKINNKAYFEDIYVQYYSKLKRFAKKYVLFEEDAENIVHDVFTMLWENCDTFSLHSNIFAFLFLSTKNKCINHLRRKAVEKDVKNNLSDEIISTLGLNYISLEAFDKNLFSEDDIESIIHKALDTLPEKCRRILL